MSIRQVAYLENLAQQVRHIDLRPRFGRLTHIDATCLHALIPDASRGDFCSITRRKGGPLLAEIVAIKGHTATLVPYGATDGLSVGAIVRPGQDGLSIKVGMSMLGRVIDPLGKSLGGLSSPSGTLHSVPVRRGAPDALDRPLIDTPLLTGLNAIDGPLTLGHGQRVGIFGPPGAGKSRLMADIARNAQVDAIVVALVGERGREVREFIDRDLPADKRNKTIIVAATSDRPSTERAICAASATAAAEWLRDQGLNVLLMVDSLTRTARALREIGLAAGEAPTRRGYPSSVYPALPALIERAGRTQRGSISAIYTVLVEGDGNGDPIAEEVRSLTDGHIVLSRTLAESGHFPAIDVTGSLSRTMPAFVTGEHLEGANNLRKLLGKYNEIEILLQIGEYSQGGDPLADHAIRVKPAVDAFLRGTSSTRRHDLKATVAQMNKALS